MGKWSGGALIGRGRNDKVGMNLTSPSCKKRDVSPDAVSRASFYIRDILFVIQVFCLLPVV